QPPAGQPPAGQHRGDDLRLQQPDLERHPAAADRALEQALRADLAAQTIRWGELPPPTPARRFEDTDRALARLDAACRCDWDRLDLSLHANRRLLFDRMIALRDRVRMAEVERHYRQLREAGIELPDYVLLAAGDALLYLRRPEEAGALYRRVLDHDPRNYNARLSLFYALVEQERHYEALELIDALAASEPVWRRTEDGRGHLQNPRRFTADLTAAMARAYADDLQAAEARLEAMLDLGPENTELQQELATVWRWRGWEKRAYETYLRLLRQEPALTGARIGAAAAALDLQRFPEAERRTESLAREYPENLHAQRELRRWRNHNRPLFIAETGYGSSTGGTFGSEEWLGQFWIYSSPLRHYWRLFVHDRYEEALFDEGTGHNHRPGAGLEYRREGVTLSGELSAGTADNGAVGLALNGAWRVDDHWRLGAAAELNSASMPLRGQHAGIRGHRLAASAAYRWHESREAGVALDYLHMSDGNNRYALGAHLRQRLLTRPLWRVEGRVDTYASHNTLRGPVYYNPENDLAVEGSLDSRWVMYRRYEQEYAHRLTLSGGGYWETGFAGDHTWTIRYQHEWKFSDRFTLGLGYSRARRVYDGDVEFQTRYFGSLEVKL
ncbi:MAG: poly-beta-1,6 N-acetyl-D-glucosamine export porin PgaA, partial [Gammaproteobacteria bacterium]